MIPFRRSLLTIFRSAPLTLLIPPPPLQGVVVMVPLVVAAGMLVAGAGLLTFDTMTRVVHDSMLACIA